MPVGACLTDSCSKRSCFNQIPNEEIHKLSDKEPAEVFSIMVGSGDVRAAYDKFIDVEFKNGFILNDLSS